MAETINTSEIAPLISKDIFSRFLWKTHPKRDDNFTCTNDEHKGDGGKKKATHPGDAVFFYEDPYLGKTVYLHTDFKSYGAESITTTRLRAAFKSLCMTVECARESAEWRQKYSVDESQRHEVRGLLFVHNHDGKYEESFDDAIDRIDLPMLPVAPGTIIHFLGPSDIQRLYNIANDLLRLVALEELPKIYSFYYPDMVINRRQGDVWEQPATIESLTGPYLIIKHGSTASCDAGYLIYYNRPASSPEELEYFLDSLSRYQMLESGECIRIRVTNSDSGHDLKSVFQTAKNKYVKAWGFDHAREIILNQINIERITCMTNTYDPGDMGWKE